MSRGERIYSWTIVALSGAGVIAGSIIIAVRW